jgi:ABC-type transport system substrate-binding protein
VGVYKIDLRSQMLEIRIEKFISSKSLFFFLNLISIFSILFTSCNSNNTVNPNTFKYNQAVGISSLDPAFSKDLANMWACSHIYEGLFILDSNAELQSLLVEDYTISSDLLSYTFKLKKNVCFHKNICFGKDSQSRELNAYDVQYSLARLIDPQTASPGAWVLKSKLDSLNPFEIIDSFSIEIKLQRPNAQFLQVLSMPYCSVIPKEAVAYYGKDFRKNPVGTGPFQFKIWDDGTVLFLEKNRTYHIYNYVDDNKDKGHKIRYRLPYLDFIKITFNENKKTELISFEKGDLSFITGLDQSMIQEVFDFEGKAIPKWKSKSNLSLKPFLNTEYFAILMTDTHSILQNKSIRKAVNYAIDRKELVRYLKYNLVLPANKGFVSAGMPNYDTSYSGYSYQPELAKKIVKKYQDLNSNYLKPKLEIHINNSFVEMAELLSHQLEAVGFEVDIKLHPADMMMQLAVDGKLPFFRRSWMADYPDAENYFACFYSKNSCPPNYTRFVNKDYDRLYEDILLETNLENRKKKYKQMEQILIEKSPIVPIFYDQSIRIIQKNVTGLEQNVLNTLDLRRVKLH